MSVAASRRRFLLGTASALVWGGPALADMMVPSGGGSGGGSGSPTNVVTLTADTNIAAGSAVSVNSAGHAVQTWGPAPNVAGVVDLISEVNFANGGLSAINVIPLGSTAFVAYSIDASGITGEVLAPATISGTSISVGSIYILGDFILSAAGLSSSSFIYYGSSGSSVTVGTISGGVITFGTPVAVPAASGLAVNSQVSSFAILSATSFVMVYGTSGDYFAIAGTISGTTITLGTGVDLGFSSSNMAVYKLSATSVVFTYADPNNNGYPTAVVGTISGTTLTLHTPVALTTSSAITPANPVVGGVLSATSFVMVWEDGPYNVRAAAASISGTTITLGAAQYCGWGAGVETSTIPVVLPLGTSAVVIGTLGTSPTVATVSGTTLTPTVGSDVPVPWFNANNVYVAGSPVIATGNGQLFPALATLTSTEFIWMDGQFSLYEGTTGGVTSPPLRHQGLQNYAIFPLTSTTILAVFSDYNQTIQARVVSWTTPNASAPIGCSAGAVTSGNPATITLSGACSGFSGLSPEAEYYANGDGTLTTANTGYRMGVAESSSQLIVQP